MPRDARSVRAGARLRTGVLAVALLAAAALAAERALAQETPTDPGLRPLEATAVGALPPMPLPMPASRNHDLWHFRLQVGQRRGREGGDLSAVGAGVDFQWRGGSVYGVTVGIQDRDCGPADPECGDHLFFGADARLNFLTGGPTIASLIGDHTATTTLGTELSLGYAPDIRPGLNACTTDLGVPLSVAMLERVRIAAYVSPAVALELDCSGGDHPTRLNFLTSFGVGVQQLGYRGLDVHLGLQKIFRSRTGYQIGISVVYVRLP